MSVPGVTFVKFFSSEGTNIGAADRNQNKDRYLHPDYISILLIHLFGGDY